MSWSERDLERVSGESHAVVWQWLGNGARPTQKISNKMAAARRIEKASGFSAAWIAQGIEPKMASASRRPGAMDDDAVGDTEMANETPALQAAVLALVMTHPNPQALLNAFDAVVMGLEATGGLSVDASAAVQRYRSQIARQAGAGR